MPLHLVRHGRPLIDRARPAHEWVLDPASYDDVWTLRASGRLPERAAWFSSPEPKALDTARLLTDGEVGVVDDLAEHRRGAGWLEDFEDAVARAFADPEQPAAPGWEPLVECERRVAAACLRIREVHRGENLVLVGHGTAWTLAVAALTGRPPDLQRWRDLAFPEVMLVPDP